MNIRQALKMAVKSISSNKARSFLTMLGVIIGLAAVIVLVSFSSGQNMAIKALYESQGTNVLNVYAYDWNSSKDVGQSLYDYCQGLDEVVGITPNGNIWNDMTISYGAKTWGQYIEKLSEYMASTGKRYRSHAATIRRWASEDARKAAPPTRNRDYSVKEDETV